MSKYITVNKYNHIPLEECQLNSKELLCQIGIDAYTAENIIIYFYKSAEDCGERCVSFSNSTLYPNATSDLKVILENEVYTVSIHPHTHFID
jgi:hypothetical protein